MTYEQYKAAIVTELKTKDLKVFPENEIDEYVEREEKWIAESYNDFLKGDPKYLQSCISSTAYAMGLAF